MSNWNIYDEVQESSPTQSTVFQQINSDPAFIGTALAQTNQGVITLRTENLSQWYDLSQGYIQVSFGISAGNNARLAADEHTTLITGGWSLFSKAELQLGSSEPLDTVEYPGLVHQMYALSRYSAAKFEANASAEWLYLDEVRVNPGGDGADVSLSMLTTVAYGYPQPYSAANQSTADTRLRYTKYNRSFAERCARTDLSAEVTLMLPLRTIFGYCDSVKTPLRGFPIQVTLTRETDYSRILFGDNAPAGAKVNISQVSMWLPAVLPSPSVELALNEMLASNSMTEVTFENRFAYFSPVYEIGTPTNFDFRVGTLAAKPTLVYAAILNENQYASIENRFPMTAPLASGTPVNAVWNQHGISNAGVFSRCYNISKMECRINQNQYPREPYELDFGTESYIRAYNDFKAIAFKDHGELSCPFDMLKYSIGPIFAFKPDISNEMFSRVRTVDLSIRGSVDSDNAADNAPGKFTVVCIVFSERYAQRRAIDGKELMST